VFVYLHVKSFRGVIIVIHINMNNGDWIKQIPEEYVFNFQKESLGCSVKICTPTQLCTYTNYVLTT
jgi:sulfite reductase beta subunit-like hemoprotein